VARGARTHRSALASQTVRFAGAGRAAGRAADGAKDRARTQLVLEVCARGARGLRAGLAVPRRGWQMRADQGWWRLGLTGRRGGQARIQHVRADKSKQMSSKMRRILNLSS
jgi:hypothetical protein